MYKLLFVSGFTFLCFVCVCMFLFVFVFTNNDNSNVKRSKLVIDNDAGADDAMAIFMALLYEKHFNGPELIALTTGHGNTKEHYVCINNQRVLKVARRQDVPIYRGSKESLVSTSSFQVGYYGKDGLGDTGNSDDANLIPARHENAVAMLIELSKKHKGHLTVVTTGALTNVALAMKLDPDFLDRLAHLYIGAGRIFTAETPEFNANMDIEAYHIVMKNAKADKVTIIHNRAEINYTREWRETVLGKINTDIMRAQNEYEAVSLNRTERWRFLDPASVAVAIKPDIVKEYVFSRNDIVLKGDDRGLITNTFVREKDANIRAVLSVKEDEYKQFLVDVFSSDKT